MRNRIRLETVKDAQRLSSIASGLKGEVRIRDSVGHCVNAKSLLGAIYSIEFEEIWIESEYDIYDKIKEFVI